MVIDSGYVTLDLGGGTVACGTAVNINITQETRDVTCKGSGRFRDYEDTFLGVTFDFEGFQEDTAGVGFLDLKAKMIAGGSLAYSIAYDNGVDAAIAMISGNAILTAASFSAPNQGESMTYSGSAQGTGAFT